MAAEFTRRKMVSLMGSITVGGSMLGKESVMAGAQDRIAEASERRRTLYRLLGDLPDRYRRLSVESVEVEERQDYNLERLVLDLNGIEPVPAVFVRPRNVSGPCPAILFNHSHGGGYDIGKREFLEGRSYLQNPPYAEVLTRNGWAGLCIDSWVFGERSHTSEADMFKAMLWKGQVLWGMMVYDNLRALDYLITRPDVDGRRIGTLGISMGSTMAWWLAALDERIKVTVDLCCLTDFDALLNRKALGLHGLYYYVPGLLKHFSTAQINALIAPRPHLALAGTEDDLTPAEGLDRIEAELDRVYAAHGRRANWKLLRYPVGHQETEEGRREILSFLERHL